MTARDDDDGALPGLGITLDDAGLEAAARNAVAYLREQGMIGPGDDLKVTLLLAVARRAGIGLTQPKTTIATTNLIRLMLDTLDSLPGTDMAPETDAWQQHRKAIDDAVKAALS